MIESENELYTWKPMYRVNIAVLDDQHRGLFKVVNDLGGAMDNKENVARVLDELMAYTETHFSEEEALMEKYNYPGLAAHKAEHAELKEKVLKFHDDFVAGSVCVSASLLMFMSRWLNYHILVTDKQYSRFLNDKGVF